MTYPHGSTASIVDNKGSNYILGASADSGAWVTSDYYVPGSTAGITQITVSFPGTVNDWHGSVREYSGVATSSPLDGSCTNNAAAPVTVQCSSPITTTASGDLILSSTMLVGGLGSNLCGSTSGSMAPGGSFVLDSADPFCSDAEEEFVQSSAGSITPSFAIGGNSSRFNIVAMAFKAASAGTKPTGMYILHQQKVFIDEQTTSQPNYFVSEGNLLVAAFETNNFNGGTGDVMSIGNCTPSNTWTKRVSNLNPYSPQILFVPSANTSTNMLCTVTQQNPGSTTLMAVYDVVGAASSPEDVDSPGAQGQATTTTQNAPSLTPKAGPGIAFAAMNIGIGPETGVAPGYVFDNTPFTGETDQSGMNNGDGWQHVFYTGTSPLNFTWSINTGAWWYAFAVSFKAGAPAPPAAPTITSVTTASATVGTPFNYLITASGSPTSYGATGLPPWALLNTTTGLISGTPNIVATSVATISASNSLGTGTATLTITVQAAPVITVTISPTSASIAVSTTLQFSATVTGSTNTSVTWSASCGTITTSGLYTAPATISSCIVTATSAANTAVSASASVTVTAPAHRFPVRKAGTHQRRI